MRGDNGRSSRRGIRGQTTEGDGGGMTQKDGENNPAAQLPKDDERSLEIMLAMATKWGFFLRYDSYNEQWDMYQPVLFGRTADEITQWIIEEFEGK